ncbi:hypothetical protein BAUCODRAFT_145352 [Baudoinia panamericana UAMH 10762]|uniref:Metal homeostatis protein bsd2 n=1 Tax=Baudoinia panamericana (strain UAMH 10762) TaxID=717646 RepID=M2MT37_BAUPA|nr:uncharacterized protein BAUCODRAFT_145352 [Baudoinia panamericana UAMH 10762]EMD00027.1 hypothetical protein BAUCODRAFT_145352 [Baudoinia panamericana UAMH 10762]
MRVQVAADDVDEHAIAPNINNDVPNSPPPSFRSRASSGRPSYDDAHQSEEQRNLNEAFDAPSDDEDDEHNPHDQRRLISGPQSPNAETPTTDEAQQRPAVGARRVTEIPVFQPTAPSGRVVGGGSNDGVWANLNAKPRAGDDLEEKPPTYEQAAADATPPYWETTVLSPYASTGNPDDVFVDGLLVGSLFSFVWNALISMSFQLIGFLLTYLLHTTHAAKHGSRAGLGITLVQYGFQMRYAASRGADPGMPSAPVDGVPDDPNAHDFASNQVATGGPGSPVDAAAGLSTSDWLAYVLMIVGWFILIRAVSDFMRARRQEQLVRSSPDRGLGVAVVAEGESPETSA